ncbi:hypothetical protein [Actinomadura sp. DC4]|uniref:RNA polymerase sigma factor n=1 Tax=Actinomadura sp. DC4 TaxID=3055069 RepID=UPI0025B2742D|nr:hypothetical protein [Actinomadura sp. DC4]MDN3357701.1 hypothetical protein [Actinomadura sp. DC4]
MSLTDALRANAPEALGALYDEYAETLYAFCHVMVGDEAGDALRDVFITVAQRPGAAPAGDAGLPVWLHSLARAECIRRGAFVRGVVTPKTADPLRHALALLGPGNREVLALSTTLDLEGTAQVLGVTRDAAETLVREARRRLDRAAADGGSAMLSALSGAALHRMVTLGYEPSPRQREWVLSSCAAALGAAGGAAVSAPVFAPVFAPDGTPLPPNAFSAQADDATHQFPVISSDEPPTAPLRAVEPGVRPDGPGLAAVGLESASAGTGEQPPVVHGTHVRQRRPVRRFLPAAALVACVAAATVTALAWPHSHRASQSSVVVHQSVRPSRTATPTPTPSDDAPSLKPATADPTRTSSPAKPKRPSRSTTRPRPRHTPSSRATVGRRPKWTCHPAFGCERPRPWRSQMRPRPYPWP